MVPFFYDGDVREVLNWISGLVADDNTGIYGMN